MSKPKLTAYPIFDYVNNSKHKVIVMFGGVEVAEVDPISPMSIYAPEDFTDMIIAETVAHYLRRLFE